MGKKRKNRGKKKTNRSSNIYKPPKKKKCGLTAMELTELCSNISLAHNMVSILTY